MLTSLLSRPTVSITLSEDQIFVHPSCYDTPTRDPLISGTILLSLPTRKAVKSIRVVLEGLCDAWGEFSLPLRFARAECYVALYVGGTGWAYDVRTSG